MNKKLLKAIKAGDTQAFYQSRLWKNKRKQMIARDDNECQKCKEEGKVGKGEVVHHIKHLIDRPDLALSDNNLLTVCYACHNELHPEKFGQGKAKPGFMNEERWE